MIDAEAAVQAEQVKGELRKLVGCRIIEVLADCDGHVGYFGVRAESSGGEVFDRCLSNVTGAETA